MLSCSFAARILAEDVHGSHLRMVRSNSSTDLGIFWAFHSISESKKYLQCGICSRALLQRRCLAEDRCSLQSKGLLKWKSSQSPSFSLALAVRPVYGRGLYAPSTQGLSLTDSLRQSHGLQGNPRTPVLLILRQHTAKYKSTAAEIDAIRVQSPQDS